MAAPKKTILEGIIGKENFNKIGTFKESTGGGTPIPKGETLEQHPEAHRVSQPRDEDGKFTYNSVNRKELKYGPSRGKTIPPFLRNVEMTFARKVKDPVIREGIVYLGSKDITPKELLDTCKDYLEMEDGLSGFMKTKRGRKSKVEKEALSSGYEGSVKRKDETEYGVRAKSDDKSGEADKKFTEDLLKVLGSGVKIKISEIVYKKNK